MQELLLTLPPETSLLSQINNNRHKLRYSELNGDPTAGPLDGWANKMGTQFRFIHRKMPPADWQVGQRFNSDSQIAFNMTVNADKLRIFQALTIPEYMEAWLCLPGGVPGRRAFALRTPNGFRIVNSGACDAKIQIAGSYQVCRRNKMIVIWTKESQAEGLSSLVSIRLYGEFSQTAFCLFHTGLSSVTEYRWHSEFWEVSLQRLRSLF